MTLGPTNESQLPYIGLGSEMALEHFVTKWHRLTELNKAVMLTCEMGQWEEGVTVGG